MRLGKTNLEVNKNGFGALPIQRRNEADSIEILTAAYDAGIDFYDTARFYTDSEQKLGKAFEDVRENIYIASKTGMETVEEFWNDLETSLKELRTDYLDLYQFHNISFCPKAEDDLYKAMLEAKEQGLIRHIGITTHKITIANEALDSGLYETLQYPFSYLSGDEELKLIDRCKNLDVGFIAMKAMGGGLIKNSKASFAYINQFDNVLPIWGIQKLTELNEFLSYDESTILDDELKSAIENDKKELGDNFCRGCGYCMPCPEEINISLCARMSLWIRRFPTEPNMDERTQDIMRKTLDCVECYECVDKCPYELDIPNLLKENYEDYQNVLTGKTRV
ncbi:aldo/keto reductase [uncultured Methanobrevibacter sp.]|uniref:aldo/keto reductase n=1 Tax=uncultured Methanobrevibacter sp. TaxID=253161 RepID=UPI0026100DD3|nr:aldo/keto reductase [uncultured Methanobrevibacter sp.]